MRKAQILVLTILNILIIGCAASKLNITKSAHDVNVKTIALMPSGGVLADAVGIELLGFGFNIFDSATTTSYMVRLNF